MIAASALQPTVRRALVVDDEVVVRTVVRRFLSLQGWTVVEAETGEEALALLTGSELPQIVVCDLNLPGLSGTALCKRIAEMHPSLASHIVLTSGDPTLARQEIESEALRCPVLGKPFSLTDLERAVNGVSAVA